jgi:hypothetical protein
MQQAWEMRNMFWSGKIREIDHRRVDNIKMELREKGCQNGNWTEVV